MLDIVRRRRLCYRAWRRGSREMDLLLGRFADAHEDMNNGTLAMFEALLDEADGDIYDWLMGDYQGRYELLIGEIRAFHGI